MTEPRQARMAGDVPLSAMRPPYAQTQRPVVALEPIGADDPRVAPFAADLEARQAEQETHEERKQLVSDGARQAIDNANSAVEAAQAELVKAQQRFDEAVAARARAHEEYYRLHGVHPGAAPLVNVSPAHNLAPGEDTVPMFFPHAVNLRADDGRVGEYPIGIHSVPVSFKDHWWLAAHGVRPFAGGAVSGKPRFDVRECRFKQGDSVIVTDGPSKGQTGTVVSIADDGLVTINTATGQVGGISQDYLRLA